MERVSNEMELANNTNGGVVCECKQFYYELVHLYSYPFSLMPSCGWRCNKVEGCQNSTVFMHIQHGFDIYWKRSACVMGKINASNLFEGGF